MHFNGVLVGAERGGLTRLTGSRGVCSPCVSRPQFGRSHDRRALGWPTPWSHLQSCRRRSRTETLSKRSSSASSRARSCRSGAPSPNTRRASKKETFICGGEPRRAVANKATRLLEPAQALHMHWPAWLRWDDSTINGFMACTLLCGRSKRVA